MKWAVSSILFPKNVWAVQQQRYRKRQAAVCQGVMLLAGAQLPSTGIVVCSKPLQIPLADMRADAAKWQQGMCKGGVQNAPADLTATVHGGVMKATTTDLRCKLHDVLKALDRNEEVTLMHRGKVRGILIPPRQKKAGKISSHPFFGMSAQQDGLSVLEELDALRKPRHDAL